MEEIERIVKSLNRKGALKVLSLLTKKGEMKFNDIARAVGHSSDAGRILKDFKRLGIVKKREFKTGSPIIARLTSDVIDALLVHRGDLEKRGPVFSRLRELFKDGRDAFGRL